MPKIDLFYFRPSCTSCERTRAVLVESKAPITLERNSRKEPLSDADVAELLGKVSKVIVARGKSTETLKAADTTIDHLRGPTGNIRAPILKVGKTLLVGFHADTLRSLMGG